MTTMRRVVAGAAFAGMLAMAGAAQAQDNLKVMVFSGVQDMPKALSGL
jgi:hypothetical protein